MSLLATFTSLEPAALCCFCPMRATRHWPQLDGPDGFGALLLEFLAQRLHQRRVH